MCARQQRKPEKQRRRRSKALIHSRCAATLLVHPFQPFDAVSVQISGDGPTQTFGLGTQLFGGPAPSQDEEDGSRDDEQCASESESDESSGEEDGVESVTNQLESTTLETTAPAEWSSSPSYKPIYLSTISEYLPPAPKGKGKSQEFPDEDVDENKKAGTDWGLEGWENSAEVDGVFERFVKRVSNESEQCVRCVFLFLRGPDEHYNNGYSGTGTTSRALLYPLARGIKFMTGSFLLLPRHRGQTNLDSRRPSSNGGPTTPARSTSAGRAAARGCSNASSCPI
jgi:hypothetical protein